MACDHEAPHSGVTRYDRGGAKLRLTIICDQCGAEQSEVASIDYRPNARRTAALLAERTAQQLGLDVHRVARLRFATLICDVGRDQIPAAILNKRDLLTAAEWRELRRQPELGAALLVDTSFDDVRAWILTRRERPDGQGYPLGLSDDQIPLEAKILAVVDAYVAITSDRPYRPARHDAFAVRELLDNSGTQFDAAVVSAFIRARPAAATEPVHIIR
jgi:HD-GYP domain-containing protein (c-di-GMP phosphodiesterase class II)